MKSTPATKQKSPEVQLFRVHLVPKRTYTREEAEVRARAIKRMGFGSLIVPVAALSVRKAGAR